jgi:hypothetical protein
MGIIEYIYGGFNVSEKIIDEIETTEKWIKKDGIIYMDENEFDPYKGFNDSKLVEETVSIINQIKKTNEKISFDTMRIDCNVCGIGCYWYLDILFDDDDQKNILTIKSMCMDYSDHSTTKTIYEYIDNRISNTSTQSLCL